MRSPVAEDAQGNLLPYSIIRQLAYVPLSSTFWIWFHMMATAKQIDFQDALWQNRSRCDDPGFRAVARLSSFSVAGC